MEHEKREQETHHVKKRKVHKNNVIVVGVVVIIVLLILVSFQLNSLNKSIAAIGTGDSSAKEAPAQPRQAAPTTTLPRAPSTDMGSLMDDDEVKGDPDAPVTMVEFSDFECPFCTRFYTQTLPQIQSEYIDTGKVRFVYRDFPLSFHANAQKAAEAAECAGEQGMFWEMHNMLFENGVSGGVSSFKQFASDLNLDTEEFNDCLDSGKMASEVQQDMADGSAMGITGTPGFIINGQKVSGAQPFDNFKRIIEAELAK